MKRLLLALLITLSVEAFASKMQPGAFSFRQSDGTYITVRGFGDEDFSYYVATDGALLVHEGSAFFIGRVADDGSLSSTGILAHDPSLRTPAELTAVSNQNRMLFYKHAKKTASVRRSMREPIDSPSLFPHTGTPKVLVILADFTDVKFSIPNPKATFSKWLNHEELFNATDDAEMGKNYGSVKKYFMDMSQGLFQPEFEVYGPVTMPNNLKYYGAGTDNTKALIEDACKAANEKVDFSNYDLDNDGRIDLVYVIYAGYSEGNAGNSSDCIWPKSGWGNISADTFDGKTIYRYGVSNELYGIQSDQAKSADIASIGVFCHEFSHCLGLPDLYPAPGSIAEQMINHNLDYYDLMDAGEHTNNGFMPTAYTAWEKECFGWTTIETLDHADDIELQPLADGGKAYRITNDNAPDGNEYYIVENIQTKGWNRRLFGEGMMVMHVDYKASDFSLGGNKTNGTPGHPRMTLIPADGIFLPSYFLGKTITESSNEEVKAWNQPLTEKYNGEAISAKIYKSEAAGDLFPGTANVTELTDTSLPAKAFVFTNEPLNKPITDIKRDEESGVITFKFMGGKTDAVSAITTTSDADCCIFSLSGIAMGNDINKLPQGIYIRNGKKIVRK